MQLTTFEPFNRLPLEIRLRIWNLSLLPRCIPLIWIPNISSCITPSIPSLLHVSNEARTEGLRFYTHQNHSSTPDQANKNRIFFNYDVDTALLCVTNYGPSFLKGLREAEPGMMDHHRFVKAVRIDWFSLDFAPGIVLSSLVGKNKFPLLEEFEVSGDHRGVLSKEERQERTFKILNSSTAGVRTEKMPILRCVENGYACEEHWWFEAWNECVEREVQCWGKCYIWVEEMADRRWGKHGENLTRYFEEDRKKRGEPLDLAEAR